MADSSGWDILSSLSSFGQLGVACWVGWYGYQKYLKEEHIEASEDRIEIFSTTKQTTELRISDKGLECYIHDIRPGRGGHQWTLSREEAQPVKVSMPATSNKSGRVSIGARHGWLYSHKLWLKPDGLEKAIIDLVNQLNA